jgi:hypothetical protein
MPVIRSGRRRPLLAAISGLLIALLAWSPALAAISWGSSTRLSPYGAEASGGFAGLSLRRTVTSGGTAYLHTAYITDTVAGDPVQVDGPYSPIWYRRGSSSGASWGTPRRLNATAEHGVNPSVATSGSRVYVAWNSTTFQPGSPEYVRVRVNTSHGASDKWRSRVNLTASGRVDRPVIAASGDNAYVIYTEQTSGEIRFHRSTDRGVTWSAAETVGAANLGSTDAYAFPVVAATGSKVVIAWSTDSAIVARVSTNGGASFGAPFDAAASTSIDISLAARSGRVALAWIEDGVGGWVKELSGSSFGSARKFVSFSPTATYKNGYSPSVALYGTSRTGVAWSACTRSDCNASSTAGVNILWRESTDKGATWKTRRTVASYADGSSRRTNQVPSALFTSSTRRIVLWQADNASGTNPHLRIRVGTGTP